MDSQRMLGEYDEQKEQLNKLISRRNNLRTAGISFGSAGVGSAVIAVINFVDNGSPVIQGVFATLFVLFGLTAVWCLGICVKLKDYKEKKEVELKELREKKEFELKEWQEKKKIEFEELQIKQKLKLEEKNNDENQAHKRKMELLEHERRMRKDEHSQQLMMELIKTVQKRPEVASEIVGVISQRISHPEYIVSDDETKYLEGTTNGQVNIDKKRSAEIILMPKNRKE